MTLALTLVPGFGGAAAAMVALAVIGVAAVAAAVSARSRGRGGAVAAVALLALTALAMRQVPSELNDRRLQYRNQAPFDASSSQAEVQGSVGVDPKFLDFVNRQLPPLASFYVVAGAAITTSAPQSWAQWSLMPRIELYRRPCGAEWLIFFDASPRLAGVRTGEPVRFGTSNDWLAQVEGRCTR